MHKNFSILLMLLFFGNSISFAQSKEDLKLSALRDAKTTSTATLGYDFETVLKHTYPSIVDIMGGKEKAIELLSSTFKSMESQGFVFEKADIINVSDIIFEQDEYRCYVEGFNQIKMNGMRIKSKSYLLGIYNQEEKIWYFIEAKQLKNSDLANQVLPDFKTSLEIPENTMETEEIKDK